MTPSEVIESSFDYTQELTGPLGARVAETWSPVANG
jgi:hypothetical protein